MPKLSVIIPTYNEAATLGQLIEKVQKVPVNKELIIVDDGSTDNTNEILQQYTSTKNIRVIYHSKNMGKGSAIRTGREFATGDITIIQDADLETDPNDYIHLLEPISSKKTKVVYGSRVLGGKTKSSFKYYFGGKFITFIANILYGQGITDEPTCYKVFDTMFFKSIPLKCKGFEFCPEITAKVSRRNMKIIELPMSYYPRSTSEGKKLRVKDGIIAAWILIKYRFVE